MKSILIITDNIADQTNGVVTTYKNLEIEARLDGYNVEYITPLDFKSFSFPKYKEIKLAIPFGIGTKIKKYSPDYIHIATEGPIGLFARNYLSFVGIKHNTAYHTKFPEAIKKIVGIPEWITWIYIKWFHRHSGKVLATTDSMVKLLLSHGLKSNIVSWTRGVDRSIFKSSLRNQTDTNISLLCVSRISKEKNLEDFLEIDYPGAKKIMVGDGPMLENYKKKYPDVQFVGEKKGIELATYYANADVFIFPSKWDTFGIVMIEAMATGTPVAAYPCQGPEDVIEQGVTGVMNDSLVGAIDQCLLLSRDKVEIGSKHWTWENTWKIFRDNLVGLK